MSEGPDIDVVSLATLDRLAALDLSAAEKAHGALMAAEAKDIPELSRAYRGLARSLRQTLALKDRLRRQRAERSESRPDPDRLARAERLDVLADAVRDAAQDAGYDPAEREDVAERFHDEAWDWIERPDFLDEDLGAQIRRARTLMDLDDEDTGDGSGDDLIEGEAREVFRPEPQPPQAAPPEPVHGCTPIHTDDADTPIGVSPCESVDRATRGPISPPSPDPFAHWPRRVIPDHPFNSS
ncbi:hypothetical protein [Phenylobacterium sp.]|uniref:hypothetical protein n=1 Tax=Phenylobacterium sp. TaxID=1871053 RepID=UPI00301E19DA